jgi:YD repeat-containing protein
VLTAISPTLALPITTTLDAEGLARSMTETLLTPPLTATWAYNANDLPLTAMVSQALTQTQGYDANSRLLTQTATSALTSTAPLSATYQYGYLPVGWTSALTTTSGVTSTTQLTQTYTHDSLGRLISAQGATTGSWGYDGDGNLLSASAGGVITTYNYTGTPTYPTPATWLPGEALVVTSTAGGSSTPTYYAYDASGRTTAISTTSSSATLGYDSAGRMSSFHYLLGPVAVTATLGYNASGLRTSYAVTSSVGTTVVSTRAETFLYRDGQIGSVGVISNGVSYTDTFVYDQQGQPLELLHNTGGTWARYFYVHDGRGNIVALTDATGKVVNTYGYDAWGNVLSSNETINQPYRYAYDSSPRCGGVRRVQVACGIKAHPRFKGAPATCVQDRKELAGRAVVIDRAIRDPTKTSPTCR